MSSSTNVTITPVPPPRPVGSTGTRSVNLGEVLGEQGRAQFAEKLRKLAADEKSGWSQVDQSTYRVAIRQELPSGVRDLSAVVKLRHGGMTVKDDWTYVPGGAVPEGLREQVLKVVNRVINQPLVEIVTNGLQERMEQRLQQKLKPKQFVKQRNSVQLHAQIRVGGRR